MSTTRGVASRRYFLRERPTGDIGARRGLATALDATTTTSADRKQIIRLVIKEVTLDQKRRRGYVWIRIVWQTGSTSEHWLHRTVHSYAQHADQDGLRQRIIELNGQQKVDGEIAHAGPGLSSS